MIPAYLFHRQDVKAVVLLGEGLAVAAVIVRHAVRHWWTSAGPERVWHLIPFIGRFNLPTLDAGLGRAWC